MKFNFFGKTDPEKYRLIKSSYLNKKNKMLLQLAKKNDNFGYMSMDVGKELEQLFSNDSYIVGIHRTGASIVHEGYLKDIFNRGLINNMDCLQGDIFRDTDYLDIKKTVDLVYDPIVLNGILKTAGRYKDSEGCIIIKIPKSYLGIEDGEIKPIYYKDGISIKLMSEYVYGYIPVSKDGTVGSIVNNPNYKDEHVYIDSEDSLFYESKAILRSRRK